MGDGYKATPSEISEAGAKTTGKAEEAEGIKGKVAEANGKVPQKAWGLLGNLGPYEIYQGLYSSFSDHVNTMVSGIQTLAGNIKATADQYQQNEDAVQDKFNEVMTDLDGAPEAPEISGGGSGDSGGA
ncbi:MAG TPA: hypothetical protein VHX38_33975 [Pseudonocardiaceae bacterium]|jgi:uncharacterized protein YukE|nr:hypothetical protein [Pseudonocardiaceae bacterium]